MRSLSPEAEARPPLVVVVGPTGAGKTALAIALAERAATEIVSADSQQVYRGMDIGTGKATAAETARVRHHLLDILRPDQKMTAARFVDLADAAIEEISARLTPAGRPPRGVVVAGGTGLYVRALLFGLFPGPPADPGVRAELEAVAAAEGVAALWRQLAAVDPESARRIDDTDQIRLTRALEVYRLTGVPLSEHQRRHDHRTVPWRYRARLIGLAPAREALYRHIDARVDGMIADGLVAEVDALRRAGYRGDLRSQAAIGYAEIHRHLDGELTLDQAITLIKRNSRRYARRQLSWYRNDPDLRWYAEAASVDLDELGRYLGG